MNEEERKEKARETAKRYYYKNKDKILARQKKYVRERYHNDEEFRKRTLENHKKYEQNNIERVRKIKRDAQKKYYENHKDYYREYSKKWSRSERNKMFNEIEMLKKTLENIDTYIHLWTLDEISEKTMLILNDILLIKNGMSEEVIRLKGE